MRNDRNKCLMLVVLIVASMVFSGCGGSSNKAAQADSVIKIGTIFPLSGNMALLGDESFRGAELAREYINARGGINGKMVEYVKGDAPTPDAARSEAERLISKEKMKVLFGSYASGNSVAASEVAERNKVIYWEGGAAADQVVQRGFKYTFRTQPTASYAGEISATFPIHVLAPKMGIKKEDLRIAIVHEDGVFGTSIARAAKKQAEAEGVKVVAFEPYQATTADLSPLILKLKNANPNVLIAIQYLTDATLFWQQSKQLGFYVPIFIGNGAGHAMIDFYKAVGGASGLFSVDVTQFEVNKKFTPGLDEFIAAYKAKYNEPPRSGHSLIHYMGALQLFEVLKKANSMDPETIKQAALQADAPEGATPTGWGVKFAPPGDPWAGQNLRAKQHIGQWNDNGQILTVWPEQAAVAEPKYPFPKWETRN